MELVFITYFKNFFQLFTVFPMPFRLGCAAALVAGVVIGFLLTRKRKKRGQAAALGGTLLGSAILECVTQLRVGELHDHVLVYVFAEFLWLSAFLGVLLGILAGHLWTNVH